MKDLLETGYLTKYDCFRMNRDQAVNLEMWFKILILTSLILRQRSPKSYKLSNFYDFRDAL